MREDAEPSPSTGGGCLAEARRERGDACRSGASPSPDPFHGPSLSRRGERGYPELTPSPPSGSHRPCRGSRWW
ncbi:hypothetical protein D8770_02795 [Methylobacterium sp. DB1607]|nr:hypothetical protein [Methylobacterium sp. DB1607]